jgi:hypothetical protein
MDIEIKRGLAEARALAGEHWQALLAYSVLGVLIPFLLLSSEPIFSLRAVMAILADPFSYRVGGSITGPLYLLGIVSAIAAGAMLAAWNAIGAEMREGYISEIMYGMVAGAAYLVANLLLAIGVGLIATLPLFILGFALGFEATMRSDAIDIGLEIYRFLISIASSWLAARLCLAGAIMGTRGKLEPLSAFAESWRLTRSAQWRLFAFYLAYGVVFAIPVVALMLLHGAIILNNAPGSAVEMAMSLGWLLLFAAYFLGQILLPAGFLRTVQPAAAAAEVFA